MAQESTQKLISDFLRRKDRNDRYSERAFAKSAGISPGFLKLLFQGKRALSLSKAREVSHRLGWSELDAAGFLTLVQREKLMRQGKAAQEPQVVEAFAEISDWYHFAIVEILKTRRTISTREISARLGISATEAEFALSALARHGLIRVTAGEPRAVEGEYVVPAMSTAAIRKFHAQMLEKARASIEDQPLHARELRSLTLAIDSRRKDEATAMLKEFMKRFEKRFGAGRPDKVYQLSMAFFSLEKESNT